MEAKVPPFNMDAIPLELKQRRQWICWRYDTREGKIVKVPVAPWKGHNGPVSVTDPDNCADFDTAVSYARKNGIGVGFVFFKGSKISGVDFDKPELYPQLVEEAKSRSYMERSVSGRGFHTLGYGVLSDAIKRDGLEAYSQDRFFVVTGAHVEGSPLKLDDIQPLLDRLQREYGRNKTATVEVKPQPAGWEGYVNRLGYTLEEVRDKDKVLDEYLRGGLAGKPSESEADMGTLERLLFWGFEPNEAVAILQHYRWREKLQRRDYVEGMLQKLLPVHERAKPNPKPLDALAETIYAGEVEVTPLANTYIPIHPAIGVVDDTAYVGVWLPSSVTYKPKKKAASPKTRVTDLLFLVTDKKELLLANEETLRARGWSLAFAPVKVKATWKKVIEYLKGNCSLDPLRLFSQILTEYQNYIEFTDEREYVLHALWDVGTYFHVLFNSYPYLYVGGIKRSGKSKVLTMHSMLAFNAFFSNNMSTPSIYRLIQNAKGTLLIDETEKLSNPDRAQEFRSIVLSGYKKGAVVYRIEKTKKDTLVPEAFEIYGPKALGNIQGLEDVLEDRCIVTIMKRGKNRKITDREVDVQSEHWSELKHGLHLVFLAFWKEVMEIYGKISEFSELNELGEHIERLSNFLGGTKKTDKLKYLTARELELWKPIFTMAKFLDNYAEKNNINIGEKLGLYRDKNEFTTPIHASSNISAGDKTGVHPSNGVSVPYNRTNETLGNQRAEDRRNMVEDGSKESTVQTNESVRGGNMPKPSYVEQVGSAPSTDGMRHLPSDSKTLDESNDSLGRVQGDRDRERQTDRPASISTNSQYPSKQGSELDRKDVQEIVENNKGVSNSSPSSQNSLSSLILDLALDKATQKQTENVTETGELILAQVLLNMVSEDNYYCVKDIRGEMAKQFDDDQKWLTTRWVGNMLRR